MHPKIALVLGGGGSRGLAHIGVLQVLERECIPIDIIIGTSMGAIVGATYALGVPPDQLANRMSDYQGNTLFSMNLFSGRARQKTVRNRLAEAMENKTFDDLKIPMAIMAVDMVNGDEIIITEGDLIPAVLASSAVPAVFPPVHHMGMQLADGGVIDSLATRPAYTMGADKVIAVDVYPPLEKDTPWVDPLSAIMGFQLPFNILSNPTQKKMPSMLSSIWRSFRVMAWHVHEERLEAHPPHILLRPAVEGYGSLDFNDISGPIEAGILEAERHLSAIKALLPENATTE